MAYRPQVVHAEVVQKNQSDGLFQVVAKFDDRNACRITFSGDLQAGTAKATHLSRLLKEPCPICRKDYLCNCLGRHIENISTQSLAYLNNSQ